MDFTLIATGLAIGLAIAAPFGPVNIMVIRGTLRRGLAGGLAAGGGSLLADSFFAVIAAYGLRAVEHFFTGHAVALDITGGVLLVGFGLHTARAHFSAADLAAPPEEASAAQLWRKGLTTFSTTVTNPGALLGVFAVFGTMAGLLRLTEGPWRPLVAVASFAVGGAVWWMALTYMVHRLKNRLRPSLLDGVNRWTGVVIAAFGFALLMQAAA